MRGFLAFEDGTVIEGRGFGSRRTVFGELVFNTSMTGYCEALTDPSYKGQILLMTYPLVGNYGVDPATFESMRIQPMGYVVRECCTTPSHYRSRMSLDEFLREQDIPGVEGVDTRRLTIRMRAQGTMKAALSTDESDIEDTILALRKMEPP